MATPISVDISEGVKKLIAQVSGFEEGTELFDQIQRYILIKVKRSNTMYFLNKKEVDQSIEGMAEKFNFHGFFPQAKALQDAYNSYIPENLPKSVHFNRLNVVKFLLCMSETPTIKFLDRPEEFSVKKEEEVADINWAEYLNEGIPEWAPNCESSEYSDISSESEETNNITERTTASSSFVPVHIDSGEKDVIVDLRTNREELLNTVQHSWYNQEIHHDKPFSQAREANIGILWERFLEKESMGLIQLPKTSILSEYKVIREILWQLWCPHASAVFEFHGNNFRAKQGVTISSARCTSLEKFIASEFVPHIEVMEFFREFSKSLDIQNDKGITLVPQTYRSYDNSVKSIMRPIYKRLLELENLVRDQETTYTLLNLVNNLSSLFEPVHLLKKIHQEIIIDFKSHSNLFCASTLLVRLHNSLPHSQSKLDQDLRMVLFLDSIGHYFTLIDAWLMKNDLTDYSREFLINNKNENVHNVSSGNPNSSTSDSDICTLNFTLNDEVECNIEENGIVRIIRQKVLQIGRNLHLLRLLGRCSLINETKETIHEEFLRRTLLELCTFFDADPDDFVNEYCEENFDGVETKYKYPVVCTDMCKNPTEMDKLENLVDTSDGFLMLAFEDYFTEKMENVEASKPTLFEKISKITTTFFPVKNFFEKILSNILKERFTISGLLVKNVLIEQYMLENQFRFLRHMFMYFDDLIFPFYRRLFEKTSSHHKNWGNDIWLTSQLQDVIMDIYPEFYEKCSVTVQDNWRLCPDSLEACSAINLQYEIQWPLNIIISSAHMALYKDIFQFILKLKWTLYTLNHLMFTDLEPKMRRSVKTKISHTTTIMKLKYLKFALTNLMNSIQHYIFSFIFTKCLQKFELDFEKANDLSSIMTSHSEFINTVLIMTMDIRNSGSDSSSFSMITSCVKQLKSLWSNLETATPDRLFDCYKTYQKSYDAIIPIIYPVYIFDY